MSIKSNIITLASKHRNRLYLTYDDVYKQLDSTYNNNSVYRIQCFNKAMISFGFKWIRNYGEWKNNGGCKVFKINGVEIFKNDDMWVKKNKLN